MHAGSGSVRTDTHLDLSLRPSEQQGPGPLGLIPPKAPELWRKCWPRLCSSGSHLLGRGGPWAQGGWQPPAFTSPACRGLLTGRRGPGRAGWSPRGCVTFPFCVGTQVSILESQAKLRQCLCRRGPTGTLRVPSSSKLSVCPGAPHFVVHSGAATGIERRPLDARGLFWALVSESDGRILQ